MSRSLPGWTRLRTALALPVRAVCWLAIAFAVRRAAYPSRPLTTAPTAPKSIWPV